MDYFSIHGGRGNAQLSSGHQELTGVSASTYRIGGVLGGPCSRISERKA